MNEVYLTPVMIEAEIDLQGCLCTSPFIPQGSIDDVEREEFPW